jgi:uracil-xanthine permease
MGEKEKYDYSALCMPNLPFCCKKPKQQVNFYGKDEPIPILLSAIMGLQHCFAMVGGLITPPLVVFRFTVCGFPFCPDLEQYAISAALITSGICTLVNVAQFPIPFSKKLRGKQLYLGSGVLSVLGTSFTFLPIYELAIKQMKEDGMSGESAYGAMIGTSMVCCLLELILSFIPMRIIKKIFPPLVTSVTVMLIGVALTGTGMKYWGGGVVCAEMGWQTHASVVDYDPALQFGPPFPTCANGETAYYYGHYKYIGLGFSVLAFLVVIEMYGSIFMKNCNVILALLFGYMVAGVSEDKFVDQDNIALAEPITFLWVHTFPISFYGPAVIPLLVAYLVTTVETIGDITAVYEASHLSTETKEYNNAIQGGLTSDAIMSIVSGLFTSMPNTTFSQNNGVIALTKCASRRAGYACGIWLILLGIFSKVAGVITSIPDCVLGGMTIFLFANVLASGIKLAGQVELQNSRRNRFILAMSLAIGVGVTVWPYAFQDRRNSPYTAAFWPCDECSITMKGIRNGVSIFLSTGYCIGTVVAMILNGILPEDPEIVFFDDQDGVAADEEDKVKLDETDDGTKEKVEPIENTA